MRFIFTSDDVGGTQNEQAVEWFEAVIEWLDGRGIPGTFFWVPKPSGKPSDESTLWLNPILRAKAKGHDFQLHGLTHHCLEFGVPHESIRRHAPRLFEPYDADPEKWREEHSLEEQRRKFEEGAAIYERAFGEAPMIFRSPCLAMCPNAYQAMHDTGIRYSSSRSVNPAATGYMMSRKPELEPWQPDYDGLPFLEPPGVTEIPCLEDLVIGGIEEEDYGLALRLFQRDLTHYIDALGPDGVGVFASHYNRIGKQMDRIPRLYEELFDWLAAEHDVTEWVTFKTELT